MAFHFHQTDFADLFLIESDQYHDSRGFFLESYKSSDFSKFNIPDFVQVNLSSSCKYALRGLHFQIAPKSQGKLIQPILGHIWDVVVDLRPKSKTFREWRGFHLDSPTKMIYVPAGFAHGFLVLSNQTQVIYQCTSEYSPEHERGIRYNDPTLNIPWPTTNPVLSDKDLHLPLLDEYLLREIT